MIIEKKLQTVKTLHQYRPTFTWKEPSLLGVFSWSLHFNYIIIFSVLLLIPWESVNQKSFSLRNVVVQILSSSIICDTIQCQWTSLSKFSLRAILYLLFFLVKWYCYSYNSFLGFSSSSTKKAWKLSFDKNRKLIKGKI